MRNLVLIALAVCCLSVHAHAYRIEAQANSGTVDAASYWATASGVGKHTLVTCWHALKDTDKVYVKIGQDWKPAKVGRIDLDNDLALLTVEQEIEWTELGDDPPQGSVVDMLASDRAQPLSMHVGKIFGDGLAKFDKTSPGNSGGPVTFKGKLIGVHKGETYDGLSRFVRVEWVRNLLRD